MTIQLTKATYVSGVLAAAGSQHTLDAQTESYLVHIGAATWVETAYTQGRFEDAKIEYDSDGVATGIVGRANEVVGPVWATDASGNVTGLVGPDGSDPTSDLVAGVWKTQHNIRLNGYVNAVRRAQGTDANEVHLSAMERALRPLVFSSAWVKIRELWVPTGNSLTAALVKIKYPYNSAGSNASLIATNFVDADYSPSIGILGDGTSKYLNSLTTPTQSLSVYGSAETGLTEAAYGFAVWARTAIHSPSGTNGYLAGCTQDSNYHTLGGFSNSAGSSDAIGASGISRCVNSAAETGPRARMQFIQNRSGYCEAGTGGLIEARMAEVQTGVSDRQVMLFCANNGSNSPVANTYYSGVISGYALFDSLDEAELMLLSNFFDELNTELGRCGTDIVFFGDSNAANTGVLPYNRWAAKVSNQLGFTKHSYTGASGTRARTSNVATIVFTADHGLITGDICHINGMGGTGYDTDASVSNLTNPGARITVIDSKTITYPCIGSDESTTSTIAGYVFRDGYRNVATNGSTVSNCPTVGSGGAANSYNRWAWTVSTGPVAQVAKDNYLYRALQYPAAWYVFNIGMNDCGFSGDIAAFETAYRATLTQLRAAGVPMKRLLLNSLTWAIVSYSPGTTHHTNALAQQYNSVIENLAIEFGCHYVHLFDLWNETNYSTYLLNESGVFVHANEAGNILIYRRVMEKFAEIT